MRHKWLVSVGVWLLLGLSLYLYAHHAWVNVVWLFLSFLLIGATVINFLFDLGGPKSKSDEVITRGGYPRWFLRFAYDDHGNSPNKTEKKKT